MDDVVPGEGVTAPAEVATPMDDEAPVVPGEGVTAPAEGVTAAAEGVATPMDHEVPVVPGPAEGVTAPAEGVATPMDLPVEDAAPVPAEVPAVEDAEIHPPEGASLWWAGGHCRVTS